MTINREHAQKASRGLDHGPPGLLGKMSFSKQVLNTEYERFCEEKSTKETCGIGPGKIL